ncbi:MAG TPA: hypothetical protein VM346_07410 [Sphingomicrobium sp.]|nr:hypothetical protein [Sphingomicrobium sp.]
MDGYRDFPSDFEPSSASETAVSSDVAAAIGTDERRMHVRAYNYWVSLLDGRDYPSIEDLEPGDLKSFADNSVLLDFTSGRDNPATPYIGAAIREECGLSDDIRAIADVPSRSLLSRLTDHYLQIIANRAPIGFEAEYVNQRGDNICYRGILMPFSSDGDTIDFIYGVINWKRVGDEAVERQTEPEAAEPAQPDAVDVADEELSSGLSEPEAAATLHPEPTAPEGADAQPPVHFSWEDGPLADVDGEEEAQEIALGEDAGLADRLWAARETAEAAKAADGRTRQALYRALSLAYDFAVASQRMPEDYAELLEESGVKAQARAPMTPIVKLVFGIDYDKTRLTEFAAALSYAQRQEVALGGFLDLIDKTPGGLKALVAAERQARRPEARPDSRTDSARAQLRSAPTIALDEINSDEEFSLVLTRRSGDGGQEAVAVIDDPAMVERAIRRAAG